MECALVVNDEHKQKRKREKKTIGHRTLSTRTHIKGSGSLTDMLYERPRTRADCINGPRPCPWVSCKYNLYLDVNNKKGSIKINHPKIKAWEMQESCALDVADRGPNTLHIVGELLNMTRERIRQIEELAITKLQMHRADYMDDIATLFDVDSVSLENIRHRAARKYYKFMDNRQKGSIKSGRRQYRSIAR